ncbi:AraC family transcriptional regulator [Paenibacillus sp. IB182496]|uniref:AraC family transcriptional regulator n=1 Tax=Paenibacillus sabuli TaxID=2772509 RepID=A0A927GSG8_9BACL|nr:AraC family transcriptional regulator [Paenibacillus sabuli]MBD2846000.1 AraC family transcriptional regulator [Paenibacillus sabuli]
MANGSLFQPDLLQGSYHPSFVAYYYKQWGVYAMPYHRHEATEIMYILSGTCLVEVQETEGVSAKVTMKKGDFILLDSNVPHRLVVDGNPPCRMLNVEFRFEERSADGSLPDIRELAEADTAIKSLVETAVSYLVLRDPDEVSHVLRSLVLELDAGGGDDRLMVRLLFAQLLLRIARLRELSGAQAIEDGDYYAARAIAYMHANYDQEIRVKDVAAAVNLHPGYLQRIFKRYEGSSVNAYLTQLRMEKAGMLLSRTDVPVADVADYVGVNSRQYFHTLFKKTYGQTPVAYRKSYGAQRWNASKS